MAPQAFHPDQLPDLSGKTYIITGGTSGIGQCTAGRLFQHNANVYICARSPSKAEAAAASIRELYPPSSSMSTDKGTINHLIMDHDDLSTVVTAAKDFCSRETALHGLVNNAGVMASPYKVTNDGYEEQWQTNHLAHWVFTRHLLPIPRTTAATTGRSGGAVRIVNLSSNGHENPPKNGIMFDDTSAEGPSSMARYGQSKLANILHAKMLNEHHGPKSAAALVDGNAEQRDGTIWTAAVHPGFVQTNLAKRATELLSWAVPLVQVFTCMGGMTDPDSGAWTSLYCIAGEGMTEEQSGRYFVPTAKLGKESVLAKDMVLARKLEEWTEGEMRKGGWIE